jgi:hypothetical protein
MMKGNDTIHVNFETIAVMLRALDYGETAMSQAEEMSGEAKVIVDNTRLIRKQLLNPLYTSIIEDAAREAREDQQVKAKRQHKPEPKKDKKDKKDKTT